MNYVAPDIAAALKNNSLELWKKNRFLASGSLMLAAPFSMKLNASLCPSRVVEEARDKPQFLLAASAFC
jgi:hypothetical protein